LRRDAERILTRLYKMDESRRTRAKPALVLSDVKVRGNHLSLKKNCLNKGME